MNRLFIMAKRFFLIYVMFIATGSALYSISWLQGGQIPYVEGLAEAFPLFVMISFLPSVVVAWVWPKLREARNKRP